MNRSEPLRSQLNRVQRGALIVAAIGLALCIVGALLNLPQFFQSYLFAYLFWLGITLGSFGWIMVHHLAGGGWGVAIRRLAETSVSLTLLMALLFIPFFFGLSHLYAWARPEVVAVDEIVHHKQPYLNAPFFIARAAVYFAAWIGLALALNRWSREQDRSGAPELAIRLRRFSGPGLLLYGLTVTFASVDWVMSLEPHWFSSIFGMLLASGQVLTALAFTIVVLALLSDREPLSEVAIERNFVNLGNLLLATVLLWIYLEFMQYLIIWSANIPESVIWYVYRLEGGWEWVALFLLLFHFALPFAVLLMRQTKRRTTRLATVAMTVMVAHLIYLFWLVKPAFHPGRFHLHWLDLVTPLAIGGIWIAAFVWQLGRRPLLPIRDPLLRETRAYGWEEPPAGWEEPPA
jgi:hypothetical protein